ncbi:MAG: efflux RND transporter periplasmic adaptor subunit [Opitutaceae bacterium]|jgi:HlyD family secretion protein
MKPADTNLAALLQPRASMTRRRLVTLIAIAAIIILVVLAFVLPRLNRSARTASPYLTEPLKRGDISLTITATGNLAPTNEVTVGSELSGTALEVYADINDKVVKGQPLAKLDTSKLAQQTEASRAAVTSAKAKVAVAAATVKESAASLARQQELHRLSGGKVPSQADLDTAIATADRAQADLASAQAAVGEANAQVLINESDLAKAVIKSPIDGIVLTRSIEPGQTVAASFTAPELFVIAENLDHMKLDVAVAEADIGRVAKGQKASFTVDAWPSRSYEADVLKVSYGSAVTDNVVTYETELEVANTDLSLRPGMTATADIRVAESKQVFLVPSSALRFNPAATGDSAPSAQKKSFVQSLTPMPPRMTTKPGKTDSSAKSAPGAARIWILVDGQPKPVSVTTGLSDERHTEVAGPDLAEGLAVITRANAVTP